MHISALHCRHHQASCTYSLRQALEISKWQHNVTHSKHTK